MFKNKRCKINYLYTSNLNMSSIYPLLFSLINCIAILTGFSSHRFKRRHKLDTFDYTLTLHKNE